MKRIVLSLLAATALLGPASAADMALRKAIAPDAPAAVFTWTGIYLGVHAGSAWASTTEDLNTISIGNAAAIPVGLPLANFSSSGFLGGGQAGFNYQIQSVVVGIEVEGAAANIKGHGPCLVVLTCSQNTKWLADVSGRLGLAHDRFLVYVKGGYAWAGNNYEASLGIAGLSATSSATRTGGLLGAGIEYAITDHWTAKLEYDHIDFGSKAFDVPVTITGVKTPISANVGFGQTLDMVKIGVNYKFGPL